MYTDWGIIFKLQTAVSGESSVNRVLLMRTVDFRAERLEVILWNALLREGGLLTDFLKMCEVLKALI
jgi:hypothetical protein